MISMSDNSGIYNVTRVKKQKVQNHDSTNVGNTPISHNSNTSGQDEIFQSWEPDITISNDMIVELPLPNYQNIQLTEQFKDTQAIVVDEKYLVVIKKLRFRDTFKFISGCNGCNNIGSDFLLYLESSPMFNSNNRTGVLLGDLICTHVKAAVSFLLSKMESWKNQVTEEVVQRFLFENLNESSDIYFYVSPKYPTYCGKLSANDGIILFELRKNRWKCGACKYQLANNCRHGPTMNFPDRIDDDNFLTPEEPAPTNIRKSSKILSNKRFASKYYILSIYYLGMPRELVAQVCVISFLFF